MNLTEATLAINQANSEAEADSATLEASLKTQFNAYVDALAAYLERLNTSNNLIGSIIRSMPEQGDRNKFSTVSGIMDNKATEYLLDDSNSNPSRNSITLVRSCSYQVLRERKAQ